MQWTLVFMLLTVVITTANTETDIKHNQHPVGQDLDKNVLSKSRTEGRAAGNEDPDKDKTPLFYVAVSFGLLCGLVSLVLVLYFIRQKLANIQPVRHSLCRQRNDSERSGGSSLITSRNEPRDPPIEDV